MGRSLFGVTILLVRQNVEICNAWQAVYIFSLCQFRSKINWREAQDMGAGSSKMAETDFGRKDARGNWSPYKPIDYGPAFAYFPETKGIS